MKKVLSVLISVFMLLSFSSCKPNRGISASSVLAEKIISGWGNVLEVIGEKQAGTVWAMEYVKEYCSSPDIKGFKNAIIAYSVLLSSSDALLEKAETPMELTEEDYLTALENEIDISYLEGSVSGIAESVLNEKMYRETFMNALYMDSFWSSGIEYLLASAELRIEEAELDFSYYRLMTNYILLGLGMKDFPEEYIEKSHGIINKETVFIRDKEDVESETDLCLDKLEAHLSKYARIESIGEANYTVFSEATEMGDWSELYSETVSWGGNYTPVPLPSWENCRIMPFYVLSDTEADDSVYLFDDIRESITDYSVMVFNVSKKAFSDYMTFLENVGGKSSLYGGSAENGEEITYIVQLGGDALIIMWRNGNLALSLDADNSYICQDWYLYSLIAQ